MKKKLLAFGLISLFTITFFAQEKSEDKKDDEKEKKPEEKTITDLTKSSKKIDGLFTIYQDTINGKLKMVVSEKHFEKEFIYLIDLIYFFNI